MTSTVPPQGSADRGIPWAVDLLLAVLLLALDAAVAFAAFFAAGLAAWRDAADGEDVSVDMGPVIGLGVVTVIAGLIAFGLIRVGRLPLAATAQCLATLALLGATLLWWSSEYHAAHPDPAPGSGYSGTYGQCRSGGDNSECAHSGG